MMRSSDHVATGNRLLAGADWGGAEAAFQAALAEGENPEALAGLGEALFFTYEVARGVELRERAYVLYKAAGNVAAAARMALWLATQHIALGNVAVGNGWVGRAERLIDDLGTCPELGWLMLRRSRLSSDPQVAEKLARDALGIAHALRDTELEIAAISQRGRALLAGGHIDEGFACIDEAMAAATAGESQSVWTVGDTCCDMIGACERAMEIERATQWCQVTDDLCRRYKLLPLFAFCRVTYAGVLIAVGRWADAEEQLGQALRSYDASFTQQRAHAIAKLAELRVLQGRDAEAEELAAGHGDHPGFARIMAMLHLARGDSLAAVRVLRKRLVAIGGDVLLAAPLLSLLVEALLAAGQRAEAASAAERLRGIATTTRRKAFDAAAKLAEARVACARQEIAAAGLFEQAVEGFVSASMPLFAARARLALARCLLDSDERAAREECRVAVNALELLGAKRDLDAATDLRRHLRVGARVGPRVASGLTKREEEVLALLPLGLSNAQIGKRLFISPKTVEHHVGHILEKLALDSRAAAAAYAAKSLANESSRKVGGPHR